MHQKAIFGDLIENFPHDWFKGWRGLLARLSGIVAPNPGAPSDLRTSFLNRRAARASLQRILTGSVKEHCFRQEEAATHEDLVDIRGPCEIGYITQVRVKGQQLPSPPQAGRGVEPSMRITGFPFAQKDVVQQIG